ncbi:MAG: hypothetical protein HQM06_14740, partial [Magnetococcales bacterium]|nr:hypothetical protein [Magnetococcales bacterium]
MIFLQQHKPWSKTLRNLNISLVFVLTMLTASTAGAYQIKLSPPEPTDKENLATTHAKGKSLPAYHRNWWRRFVDDAVSKKEAPIHEIFTCHALHYDDANRNELCRQMQNERTKSSVGFQGYIRGSEWNDDPSFIPTDNNPFCKVGIKTKSRTTRVAGGLMKAPVGGH